MNISYDCLPCFLKQAIEATLMVTNDKTIQKAIIKDSIKIIENFENYKYSPSIGREIHNIVKKHTRNADPYKEIKNKNIEDALKIYPFLKSFLKSKNDTNYWVMKIAVTGNIIDSAIYGNVDVKSVTENELKKEFKACHIDIFNNMLNDKSKILIIGDNAGETVFDRILVEKFSTFDVTYAVRSEPIINDATIKEVYKSGFDKNIHIISTGCNAPGTIIEECSKEFLDIYNNADIIISKGQGNFESLSEEKKDIFFLLKAKCKMVAAKLGVNVGDYVFVFNKEQY